MCRPTLWAVGSKQKNQPYMVYLLDLEFYLSIQEGLCLIWELGRLVRGSWEEGTDLDSFKIAFLQVQKLLNSQNTIRRIVSITFWMRFVAVEPIVTCQQLARSTVEDDDGGWWSAVISGRVQNRDNYPNPLLIIDLAWSFYYLISWDHNMYVSVRRPLWFPINAVTISGYLKEAEIGVRTTEEDGFSFSPGISTTK